MKTSNTLLPCEMRGKASAAGHSAHISRTYRNLRPASGLAFVLALMVMVLTGQTAFGQQFGWSQATPLASPPARNFHTMAYDAIRREIVLFGGAGGPGILSDTWVWDGSNWHQRSPATVPPPRYSPTFAYDAARGQVVMFGGVSGAVGPNPTYLTDTWVWDGSNWTQKFPATVPPSRLSSAMEYDVARNQLVMFGGFNPSAGLLSDTWVWDGNNWTQKSPQVSPISRYGHSMAFDHARGRVMVFGGGSGSGARNDTWEWDGANWVQMPSANAPAGMADFAMASDSRNNQVVLFGGQSGYLTHRSETWVWGLNGWTLQAPAVVPPRRSALAMAYDTAREQVVMFGGQSIDGEIGFVTNDTWLYERLTPVRISANLPTATFSVSGTYCQPGSNYPVPSTLHWAPGASCTVTFANAIATNEPGIRNSFVRWNDSNEGATRTFLPTREPLNYEGIYTQEYLLTTNVSPAAAGTATGGGWYNRSSVANITATPAPGYSFSNWTGPAASPSASSTTVSMNRPETVTANFTSLVPVTITSATSQATFTVSGTGCAAGSYPVPQTLQWMPGSNCTVAFATLVSGGPGTQHLFSGWTDNVAGNSRVIAAPASATTYAGTYRTQYLLTVAANPAVGGTVSTGGYFDSGSTQPVTATANAGHLFTGWTGPVASPAASSTTVSMTQPQTVTANFTSFVPVTITSATAQATFSVTGTGCAPGSYPVPQTLQWTPGSNCTVTFATPISGGAGTQYRFTSWTDNVASNSRVILAPASATTYAGVYQTQYLLTINAAPAAGGTVSAGGYFDSGSTQPVTAAANAGYSFSSWTGPVASPAASSTTVSMTQPQTVAANFTSLVPVTITSATAQATFSITGTGCAPGSYAVPQTLQWTPGSNCTVTFATLVSGGTGTQYVFIGWTDNVAGNSRTLTVPAAAVTYAAAYKTQYQLLTLVNPVGAGTATGAGFYDANTPASVVATAGLGYQFIGWAPSLSPNTASSTVSMTGPRSVTANFALPTALSVEPASGQYSDPVTLRAIVGPAGAPIFGSLQFQVDGVNAGAPVPVNGSGLYSTSYLVGGSAGSRSITAVLTSSTPLALGATGSNLLTVAREEAAILPASSNPTTVQVTSPGGTVSTLTLTGQLQEVTDQSPGDLSKAMVTVLLQPAISGTSPIACAVNQTAGALTATCLNVPVNAYTVQWSITGGYYQGPQRNSVLAVFDPSLGFVTGGGTVVIDGVPATFSVSVKYNKNGTIGGGGVAMLLHRATGDVRISSTSLASMSIVGTTAVIDGQASVNGSGSFPLRVIVTDHGEPGINRDLFGVQASPTVSSNPVPISGGNIQVH